MAMVPLMLAAGPASRPVLDRTIARGQYQLASPPSPEWSAVKADPDAEAVLFVNAKHDGEIQLELLPKDARVGQDVVGSMSVAIMKELKRQRAANHTEVVMPAKLEHDPRFAILIHEKYKVEDKVCDERYAYNGVGPRVLLLSVFSLSDNPETTAAIHKAGEAVLASVKFDRKTFRKPT